MARQVNNSIIMTNYMVNPKCVPIDNIVFNFNLESSEQDVMQTAYRIRVARDRDMQKIVHDTKRLERNKCIAVPYYGNRLDYRTTYYWQVEIWDEKDESYLSDVASFTTEAGDILADAHWIGADISRTNGAALDTYEITTELEILEGTRAGLVIAGRDKDNYVLIDIDKEKSKIYLYESSDNAWEESIEKRSPSCAKIGRESGYDFIFKSKYIKIKIAVDKTKISIEIDDNTIIDREDILPQNPINQPRKAYMMNIGFKQIEGCAVYKKIKVINTKTGEIYKDCDLTKRGNVFQAAGEITEEGLLIRDRFELINPIPAITLKKKISCDKKIKSAKIYSTARGFYNIYINGEKANDEFYAPGFTDYNIKMFYQTIDVTNNLKQGDNNIVVIVGKGYYSGYCGYSGAMIYGEDNSFIGKIIIEYEDKSQEIIKTDKSWSYTDAGPVIDADYLDGEQYDARLEDIFHDHMEYAYRPCGIKDVDHKVVPVNGTFDREYSFSVKAQTYEGAKIREVLKPVKKWCSKSGHYIYDMGQNMVGSVRIRLQGKRGDSIKIRYAEMCNANGEVYLSNLRTAANTDIYTLRGDRDGETYVPSYSSHGYRYVEITGNGRILESDNMIISVEGLVISNIHRKTGSFECDNELVNALQHNIVWGQKGNYLLVPTDCPQRNERMGWTGDAQVFAATAAYNMDVASFTDKWIQDMIEAQIMYNKHGAVPDTAPLGGDNRLDGCGGWGDAAVIVPWEMYREYGDIRILERSYDLMCRWVDYQSREDRQNYGIRVVDGVEVRDQSDLAEIPFIQVQQRRGDHLAYDESTPYILVATAYAAYSAKILSRVSKILCMMENQIKYNERFLRIKKAFCQAWVNEDGTMHYYGEMSKNTKDRNGNIINKTIYSDEPGSKNRPSQTAYALALRMGLIEIGAADIATDRLAKVVRENDYHISTGFLGISHICPAIGKVEYNYDAEKLLLQQGTPGWLYSVINGATTIWERWDSFNAQTGEFGDVSMNSFNHYAYGAVGEWMYKEILGIKLKDIAYKKIVFAPGQFKTITHAKGYHMSVYGKIEVEWSFKDKVFTLRCVVPPNCTAKIEPPYINDEVEIGSGEHYYCKKIIK